MRHYRIFKSASGFSAILRHGWSFDPDSHVDEQEFPNLDALRVGVRKTRLTPCVCVACEAALRIEIRELRLSHSTPAPLFDALGRVILS